MLPLASFFSFSLADGGLSIDPRIEPRRSMAGCWLCTLRCKNTSRSSDPPPALPTNHAHHHMTNGSVTWHMGAASLLEATKLQPKTMASAWQVQCTPKDDLSAATLVRKHILNCYTKKKLSKYTFSIYISKSQPLLNTSMLSYCCR